MNLLILPVNLYRIDYLPTEVKKIYVYEHPQYFTKYNFNKKKLILHRASMKQYAEYLKKKKYNVEYIDFNKELNLDLEYVCFDPIDKIDFKNLKIDIKESPNFLISKEIMEKYRSKNKKFFFNSFYMNLKKELNILPNVKSQDKANRKRLPKDISIPNLINFKENKYVKEAKKYIELHFKTNYGNIDNFIYPTNHKEAIKMLDDFIKNKFNSFGDYQDFILEDNDYLFHSCLSSSINIGLLNPSDIIEKIRPLEKKIPINSYEGYIRQLFWREYQRYCYIYCNFNKNYFGNKKKLNKQWYDGSLGCDPVDHAIKRGFDTGYLHHIYRLMVVGNYMNLSGISPKEGLKWFMEFSCDSYEWVMYQNVFDMVFFVTGGETMRKPYASSSNYVVNMSNFKRGEWSKKWDEMYKEFVLNNKDKLWKFRYHFPLLTKK